MSEEFKLGDKIRFAFPVFQGDLCVKGHGVFLAVEEFKVGDFPEGPRVGDIPTGPQPGKNYQVRVYSDMLNECYVVETQDGVIRIPVADIIAIERLEDE